MRIMRAITLAGITLGILFAWPGLAAAQKSSGSRQAAARLLDEGVARYDAGDYQGALEKFRAAYDTYASAKIFLNIGEALRKLHKDLDAAEAFERFLADTANAPEVSDAKKALARSALAELRPRLGRLRVDADLSSSATLTLDGAPFHPPFGRPVYVMPGRHELIANAPGYLEKRRTVDVAGGEEKRVTLMLEAVTAQPAPPPPKPQPQPPAPLPPEPEVPPPPPAPEAA